MCWSMKWKIRIASHHRFFIPHLSLTGMRVSHGRRMEQPRVTLSLVKLYTNCTWGSAACLILDSEPVNTFLFWWKFTGFPGSLGSCFGWALALLLIPHLWGHTSASAGTYFHCFMLHHEPVKRCCQVPPSEESRKCPNTDIVLLWEDTSPEFSLYFCSYSFGLTEKQFHLRLMYLYKIFPSLICWFSLYTSCFPTKLKTFLCFSGIFHFLSKYISSPTWNQVYEDCK